MLLRNALRGDEAAYTASQAPPPKTVIADTDVSRIALFGKKWLLTRRGYCEWLAYAAHPRFSYARVAARLGERGSPSALFSVGEIEAALDAAPACGEVSFCAGMSYSSVELGVYVHARAASLSQPVLCGRFASTKAGCLSSCPCFPRQSTAQWCRCMTLWGRWLEHVAHNILPKALTVHDGRASLSQWGVAVGMHLPRSLEPGGNIMPWT